MNNNVFEFLIKSCGSVEQAARKIGTSQQNMSSWRNGRTWVRYPKALRIAKYLWLFARRKIDPLVLVSPSFRNAMKSVDFSFTHHAIETAEIPIKSVVCDFSTPDFLVENIPMYALKTPILDENNRIITHAETYFIYRKSDKKTMPVWTISLPALISCEYSLADLGKAFDLMELTAIGIALEQFIGNRQGERRDLKELVVNSPQVNLAKGTKTRNLVITQLGFSSDYSYRQLKKIIQNGCAELIYQVRHKKIALSKAVCLARLSHTDQLKKLTTTTGL